MNARVVARVPPELLQRGRMLRPVDAQEIYTNPRAEFARLERQGVLHRLAPGLFAAVPDYAVGAIEPGADYVLMPRGNALTRRDVVQQADQRA